jgi:hypothetical protein
MTDPVIESTLKDVYRHGNISFFLGAGVSASSGIPTWDELVTAMYFRYMAAEEWGRLRPYPNYLYAASRHLIRRMKESPDIIIRKLKTGWKSYPDEYYRALWDSLYNSRLDNAVIYFAEGKSLPSAIARLIKSGMTETKVKSVITYNFDDIIEEAMHSHGYDNFKPVFERISDLQPGTFPIFHVHGFIPYQGNHDKESFGNIILGEDDYNNLMNDSNNWANLVQITTLASTTNLMIGLSLADRNLRRILDITSKQSFVMHPTYIFLKRPQKIIFEPGEVDQIHQDAIKLLEKWSMGGGVKTEKRMPDQLEQILNGILDNEYENNNRMLEEMKVTPIWVDEFDDIAEYLNKMTP